MQRTKAAWWMIACAVAWLTTGPAPAQQIARNDFNRGYPTQRLNLMVRTSDVLGTMVWDQQGHRLGRIQDFLVDPDSWRIVCALLRPADLYGPAEYYVAVPARSFVTVDADRAVVSTTVTNFVGLPRFHTEATNDAADMSKAVKLMYDRFGQETYWDASNGLAKLVRCRVWLDMEVADQSGKDIGRLSDFVLDLPAERVVFAAVTFFGWESDLHVMPPQALSVATNGGSLVLPLDAGRVGGFLEGDVFLWTKVADPAYVSAVYRAFGQQLDLAPPPALDAALAKVREPLPPPPPMFPPVASPETNLPRGILTAFIQEDMANVDAAQSIKVTVVDGNVTLAGRVDNEQQRRDLLRIAERLAGAGKVTNQLEVK